MIKSIQYCDHPILSIITVCRNSERTISTTIKSVLYALNRFESLEYIIQDGFSTDNTIHIVNEMTFEHPRINVFQEVDNGIYDAMNKGMQRANAKYILYLNSDDILLEEFSSEYFIRLLDNDLDYIVAPVLFFKRPSLKIRRIWNVGNNKSNILSRLFLASYPPHPGFVCKTKHLRKFKFDTRFSIAADYLQMKLITSNKELKMNYCKKPIIAMAMGGKSNQFNGLLKASREIKEIQLITKEKESILIRYIRNLIQHIIPWFRKERFVKTYFK